MTLTAGVISLVANGSTEVLLSATAATGGTGPYTYQWYRSTITGFTPGGGNSLSGKTALTLDDTTVIPGTLYYYKVVATDTGNSNATIEYVQLVNTTLNPTQSQNQFQMSSQLGMIDLRYDYNTISAQVDVSQVGSLYSGAAVKVVDSAGGVPKVIAVAANADEVFGFINYDIKSKAYVAGDSLEISQAGNVMFLYATTAIARGARCQLAISTNGGVAAITTAGADIVGWALDKGAIGDLIRVHLLVPSFAKAT